MIRHFFVAFSFVLCALFAAPAAWAGSYLDRASLMLDETRKEGDLLQPRTHDRELVLVIQALVFALIASGVPPHWACLIVAAVLACLGAFAYFKGRQDASKGLAPERAINQIKEDIKSTKEQLV